MVNRRFRAQKKPLIIGGTIGVVAIAGIIAGVYFFSVDSSPSYEYIVPGVPPPVPLDQIVKIGYLFDLKHIGGDHAWKGLLLAAREINERGGIVINGNQYYIGLVREDTKEMSPGNIPDGIKATNYMINNHEPHFLTGGGSGDPFHEYLKIIMEHKIPFISTLSATNELCDYVLNDYETYKYFFRNMPGNWSAIGSEIVSHIISLAKYLNATYGGTGKNKIAILHENSSFGNEASYIFEWALPNFNLTVVENIPYSESATQDDFEMYWNQIETAEAQITMILQMRDPKEVLIAKTYQAVQPHCLLFNPSNFETYSSTYWDDTEGACQFEIILQAIYNTSKTSLTKPFFNSFINEYGHEPWHPGTGSYDAVYLLAHAVNDSQSFNADKIVTTLEKINITNYWTGAGGKLAFTSSHDVLRGYPHGYGLLCQYKYIDETKIVISSDGVYPDSIATGSLRLPYWGINGLLTDSPDPPGNFTINSTAETPDLDGKFNLTWTVSEGAENYSVYMSDKSMSYISKNFDLLAYQTATSPLPISLKQGEHYFSVVAYNKTGERMSSNDVYVNISGPESFSLDDDAGEPVDTDGVFDLFWTPSARAENYSVFRYHKKISSINESLTCLANQTTATFFHVTRSPNGKYYFAVAAFNEMGYTLSNNKDIVVKIPFDWTVVLIVTISSAVGVASIILIWQYHKYKGKIKTEREQREPIIVEDVTREPLERKKAGEMNKLEEKKK